MVNPGPSSDSPVRRPWLKPRFFALLLGVAAPMNAATAIFIWYLTPLTLAAMGSGPAEIARVVMLYYLAVILIGPPVAHISDGRTGPLIPLVCGALVSGTALLSLTIWSGFWAVVAAVAGLGVGHTMTRAPLYALTLRVTGWSNAGLGVLRLTERVGAIVGLAASAWLLGNVGSGMSVQALGIVTLLGIAIYAILEIIERSRSA